MSVCYITAMQRRHNKEDMDEIQNKMEYQNRVTEQITDGVNKLSHAFEQMNQISSNLTQSMEASNQAASNIAQSTTVTAEAIQEQTLMSVNIQSNMKEAANATEQIKDSSNHTNQIVDESVTVIEQLKSHSVSVKENSESTIKARSEERRVGKECLRLC